MTKVQKIYRELRNHVSREDARYAAPRLVELGSKWLDHQYNASRNRIEERAAYHRLFG